MTYSSIGGMDYCTHLFTGNFQNNVAGTNPDPPKEVNKMNSFRIRETTSADVPTLAHLHVTTFNETHAPVLQNGPTYEVREYQWRKAFEEADGSWVCFVVEDVQGKLIGFAKGQPYAHSDQPSFSGELNKIYVLREHHRRGLGRRLLGHVARRFLSQGTSSMLLFGDAANVSNPFYEVLDEARILRLRRRWPHHHSGSWPSSP